MINDYLENTYVAGLASRPIQNRLKYGYTSILKPVERRKAAEIASVTDEIKLHLGCGNTYLPGWVNVDLARPGRKLDLRWDIRWGIPFPDNSVRAVFSEHLFEHIDLRSVLKLLSECHRVLEPRGIFRCGVPDLERYIQSYLGNDPIIEEVRPGRPTRAIAMSEIFFFHGHSSAYDFDTFKLLLETAGFVDIEKSTYKGGALAESPDSINRKPETLYVEARASDGS